MVRVQEGMWARSGRSGSGAGVQARNCAPLLSCDSADDPELWAAAHGEVAPPGCSGGRILSRAIRPAEEGDLVRASAEPGSVTRGRPPAEPAGGAGGEWTGGVLSLGIEGSRKINPRRLPDIPFPARVTRGRGEGAGRAKGAYEDAHMRVDGENAVKALCRAVEADAASEGT